MELQQIIDGLNALGFKDGYAAGGEPAAIIVWENAEPQPTMKAIESASLQGAYNREVEAVKAQRHAAYTAPDGSDALFMKFQRQEDGVTKQAWLDRIAEINAAHPYPESPVK